MYSNLGDIQILETTSSTSSSLQFKTLDSQPPAMQSIIQTIPYAREIQRCSHNAISYTFLSPAKDLADAQTIEPDSHQRHTNSNDINGQQNKGSSHELRAEDAEKH